MAYENLCMYCFEDLNGTTVCPHCGKDANAAVPQIQMLPGTAVYHSRFLVGRALGQDSSGIVYNALDMKKGNTIRIREYLPRNCAERLNDGSVVPIAGMEDAFETGMRKLKASVENPEDPAKRHFYFEENGTAYIAQRRNASASSMNVSSDDDDDDELPKNRIGLYLGIGAAVIAIVIVGVLFMLNNRSHDDQTVLPTPSATADVQTTWLPAETPTPTPYATPTFAALIDPELSWLDFATAVPVTATTTPKPILDTTTTYSTVKTGSDASSVKKLQNRLVELGWLAKSRVSGNYDTATTQAVKDFQTYVNENCSPAEKLVVDGIAGSKTQQWLYNASVALLKPTPTPKPIVTAVPDTSVVGASSSSKEIRGVQKKLIALGLLPEGSADGKYGSSTKAAVRNFQTRVNELLGYDVLEVTGTVNDLTMAYLDYYIDWWEELRTATATPKVKSTPTPKPKATATATAKVTPTATTEIVEDEPEEKIDKSSSKEEIHSLQERLVSVGLLKSGDVDGVYGKKTVSAVKDFQRWINTDRGAQTVEVTGIADSMTLKYLEYCIENDIQAVSLTKPTAVATEAPTDEPTKEPTAEPTSEPTKEPEQEVYEPEDGEGESGYTGIDPSSESDSIRYMQQMLSAIRLIDYDSVTGTYDNTTMDAIRLFQEFVNRVQNTETLKVTGICDADTLQYLEYASDRNWDVGTEMGVVTETEEKPDAEGLNETIDGSSDGEAIKRVQSMLCNVGLLSGTNGKYDAETEQAVLKAQRFINSVMGSGTVPENGICDAETLRMLSEAVSEGWNMGDNGDEPGEMNEENEEPTAEPTEEPTPEPTQVPVAEIENFSITVDGNNVGDTVELDPGKYTIAWNADGVESYSLYLYTQDGALVNKMENTDKTGFALDTAGMVEGAVYEVRIGALPKNGTAEDMQWRSLYLSLKAAPVLEESEPMEEPEPEPFDDEEEWNEPVEEPEVVEPEPENKTEKHYVGTPVINIGSSVYQQGGVTYINDDTVIFSWMADGDLESYDVVLIYEDGTRFALGTTTDTSRTVNTKQLQPGMYTLVVNANPIGGGESTSAQLTFCVPEVPSAIEEDTDEKETSETAEQDNVVVNEEIMNIQMALYRYGLLNPDNISAGVLDYETLAAVSDFQETVNEQYGYNLPILDPGSATAIDLETINVLLNERPQLY